MTDQASMTLNMSKSSLLMVLLHVYFLCKLRYIKQTIIQHLTHLLCSERLVSYFLFWYKGRHVVTSVMILFYRVCAAFLVLFADVEYVKWENIKKIAQQSQHSQKKQKKGQKEPRGERKER